MTIPTTLTPAEKELMDAREREAKRDEYDYTLTLANAVISIQRELPTLSDDDALELAKGKIAQGVYIPNDAAIDNLNHSLDVLDDMRDNLSDNEIGDLYENESEWKIIFLKGNEMNDETYTEEERSEMDSQIALGINPETGLPFEEGVTFPHGAAWDLCRECLRDSLAAEQAHDSELQDRIETLNRENHAINAALELAQHRATVAEKEVDQLALRCYALSGSKEDGDKMTYIATARLCPPPEGDIAVNDITARGETAAQAAQALTEMTAITALQFHRLISRGFVHIGFDANGKEQYLAIDIDHRKDMTFVTSADLRASVRS